MKLPSLMLSFTCRCFEKNLTFKYHDCQQYLLEPPMFNACLTVSGVTIIRQGKSLWEARNVAALAMIRLLQGRTVELGQLKSEGDTSITDVMTDMQTELENNSEIISQEDNESNSSIITRSSTQKEAESLSDSKPDWNTSVEQLTHP